MQTSEQDSEYRRSSYLWFLIYHSVFLDTKFKVVGSFFGIKICGFCMAVVMIVAAVVPDDRKKLRGKPVTFDAIPLPKIDLVVSPTVTSNCN